MRAGALRRQVILQTKGTPTRDSLGGEVITWTTFATVWAEREVISGQEYISLRMAQEDIVARYRIRYLAGVNPSMRVSDGGTIYEVVAVVPDAKNTELQLLVRADAPNA